MALATLSIDLTANLAKLQEGMDKSQRMLDQLRDKATGAGTTLNHKFRVVSLGTAGTGAVGTTGVIQRVC